jgi:hypothetical protein
MILAVVALIFGMPTHPLCAQGDGVASHSFELFSNPVHKLNPGLNINSRFDETKPIISPDGKRLYFARKHSSTNMGGISDPQDIYFSETTDGIHWTAAQNAGSSINTNNADNLCGVIDNSRFVFYVMGGKNKGRFVVRGNHIGINSPAETIGPVVLNESGYLEGFFSADGQTILYTAKTRNNLHYRKDADERDIYISRKESGGWSIPVNIGPQINSTGDEFSPFLSADGRTIYFASDGRGGYGRADIFVSRRVGSGWHDWTPPENLGPDINSEKFDGYFSVGLNSGTAYIVSRSSSIGKTDIITVTLPEKFRPASVIDYRFRIEDLRTGKPIAAKIRIYQNGNLATEGIAECDGTALLMAGIADVSRVQVCAEGYDWFEESIAPDNGDPRIIRLSQTSRMQEWKCGNILFEKGNSNLLAESSVVLDSLVTLLRSNPAMEIQLRGHTDNSGTFPALKRLSEKRVAVISSYLQNKGIRRQRISGMGLGSSQPVSANDTEENKKKNRRVEILLKQSQFDL